MTALTSMTIGQLAAAGGVGVETVRYYQRRQLLPQPARPLGGIRRYAAADLRRLRFIRHARELGFALQEIADLLQLDDGMECAQAQAIATEKRVSIRARIERLHKIDQVLEGLLQLCQNQNQNQSQESARCPLIKSLGTADNPIEV